MHILNITMSVQKRVYNINEIYLDIWFWTDHEVIIYNECKL